MKMYEEQELTMQVFSEPDNIATNDSDGIVSENNHFVVSPVILNENICFSSNLHQHLVDGIHTKCLKWVIIHMQQFNREIHLIRWEMVTTLARGYVTVARCQQLEMEKLLTMPHFEILAPDFHRQRLV